MQQAVNACCFFRSAMKLLENTPSSIKVLSPSLQAYLLQRCNVQYKLIVLLMLDGGLRVSETVQLQVKHINTLSRAVTVRTLKKRRYATREVPMTDRLLDALTDYWKKLKDKSPDAYLFPGTKTSSCLFKNRKSVWRRIKKYSDGIVNPHMLRHTFASRVVNENEGFQGLLAAKEVLGHTDVRTTQVYAHVPKAQILHAVQRIEKKAVWKKWLDRLFPPQRIQIVPMERGLTKFHIGRKAELARLADLARKKVNTIIIGPQGVGKTHLLDNYQQSQVIRLDDFRSTKAVLAGILIQLVETDFDRAELMLQIQEDRMGKIIAKKSTKFIIQDMIHLTKPQEFTLIIDDLSHVTPTAVSALEKLKNHFHIIAAARAIPLAKASFLTNFERIDLKPLSRPETMLLTGKLARPFHDRIGDWESFKNHIWECTGGNPLFVHEMIERYQKEPDLNEAVVKDIRHATAKKEINFLPFLISIFACMSILRYWGRITGTDSGPWYFLASIGVVFLFFGRSIVKATKRRYI